MSLKDKESAESGTNKIETARRILNLLFVFNAAPTGLTTTQIITDTDLGYGGGTDESERKKFRRDRKRLQNLGFIIQEDKPLGESETEESSWVLDRRQTHINVSSISADDADTLIHAIDEYLGRKDIVFREPLLHIRSTLTSLNKSGAQNHITTSESEQSKNAILDTLWTAHHQKKQLIITYCDAAGKTSKRTVNIYGFHYQQGSCYFVAYDSLTQSIRTFRADRVLKALKPKGSFQIPVDFDLKAHVFLPLDFTNSAEKIDAVFTFPAGSAPDELQKITKGRGTLNHVEDNSWTWTISDVDSRGAARMALKNAARGMRPLSPEILIQQWNELLEEAVCAHE